MNQTPNKYVKNNADRNQILLLPENIDNYIDKENETRFIDAYVNSLNLIELGFTHSKPHEKGRPPYDPKDLLKLYIWGYLNQIRSSRKLEKECHRNLEIIWLIKKLTPDFWTIAEFRKQNADKIKGVFRNFLAFLQDIDLVEGKLTSIDGSKIKAVNSRKKHFTKDSLTLQLKRVEARVEKYLHEMDQNDKLETGGEANKDRELIKKRSIYLKAKLQKLQKSKQNLETIRTMMNDSGKDEISLTDSQSRLMKNNGKIEVCYNAELSIDSKKHLIVDYSVTNEANDERQLAPMALSTKEVLGVDKLEVTADTGFVNMAQIKQCVDNGIVLYLPSGKLDGSKTGGGNVPDLVAFGKDKFCYDKGSDVYVCPAGCDLVFRHVKENRGKSIRVYSTDACGVCSFRVRCVGGKSRRRTVTRWEHQDVVDLVVEQSRQTPEKLEERSKLAEHPFGTIKRAFNQGYFLLRGLVKVNGEMGFTALAYNFRRVLNILGVSCLLVALKEWLVKGRFSPVVAEK